MMSSPNRPRCPKCRSPLHRRHRRGPEHLISVVLRRRPYQCKQSHCVWRGWLPFQEPLDPSRATDPRLEFLAPVEVGRDNWNSLM